MRLLLLLTVFMLGLVGASAQMSTLGVGNNSGGGTPATQAPTVTGLSPSSGPTTGGTAVTITGTQFIGVAGASGVVFGANNASSYTALSPTSILATAPPGSVGTVDVRVTNPIGQSAIAVADQYTYTAASGCGPGSADFTVQCNDQYYAAVN